MKIFSQTKSLLQMVKAKTGYAASNIIKKGAKKIQTASLEKTAPLIEDNIKKTYTSQRMYINQSLIKYSKDKTLHDNLKSMTKSELTKFLQNKDNHIINYDSFKDDSNTKKIAFIIYAGGKQKYKTQQQQIMASMLANNAEINSYYEMFLGGFGGVYNSLPILLEAGIQNLYLSDINRSLINAYKQVQKNPKQVQRHLASIDLEYFKEYKKSFPENKEEGKAWFNTIYKEFSNLEKLNRMNPKRAAYFMYLMSNTQGGMLKYDMQTKTNQLEHSFDPHKAKSIALLINKVEIFHQIFNMVNMKFSVKSYETVHNKIKNDTKALVLHDSPYTKYTEVASAEKMKSCSYSYGMNDFEQEPLLLKITNSKYKVIYYNNHNPIIEQFAKTNALTYIQMQTVYTNGATNTKSIEIVMHSNANHISQQAVNSSVYLSNKIKQAS